MNLVKLMCESCGAALDATDAPTVFQCGHCGARFAFPPEAGAGDEAFEEMSDEAAAVKVQIDQLDAAYRTRLLQYHAMSQSSPKLYHWFHEAGAQETYADYLEKRARLVELYKAL